LATSGVWIARGFTVGVVVVFAMIGGFWLLLDPLPVPLPALRTGGAFLFLSEGALVAFLDPPDSPVATVVNIENEDVILLLEENEIRVRRIQEREGPRERLTGV
jgi:hypothetical protein